MVTFKKSTVRRSTRTDAIIRLQQKYEGDVGADPGTYNRAFANVLRQMADAIEKMLRTAWVDPEVVVWMHQPGVIKAEVPLSPLET